MVYPRIHCQQFYSFSPDEHLTIMFEDLDMISLEHLATIVRTKSYANFTLIPELLTFDTINKTINLRGNRINNTTYIVQRNGGGDLFTISYTCSNEDIITGIEYLYHMYKSL